MFAAPVLGLGRVCRDLYFLANESASRFDSRKVDAELIGEVLGGSVPTILEVVARNSYPVLQVAGVGSTSGSRQFVEAGLQKKHLDLYPVSTVSLPESAVVLNADGSLREIIVGSEASGSSIVVGSDLSGIPINSDTPAVVFDTRHPEAARKLAQMARAHGVLSMADPGSLGGIKARARATLAALREADIVFAGSTTLQMLAGGATLSALLSELLAGHRRTVIITRPDGGCDVHTSEGHFQLDPIDVKPCGSSVGTGDLCRGFTLLSLLKDSRCSQSTNQAGLREALIWGLAAAAWRIEDTSPFPSVPDLQELEPYLRRVRTVNHIGQGDAF